MILKIYEKLKEIALKEFNDIVADTEIIYLKSKEPVKLRLLLNDKTIGNNSGFQKNQSFCHCEELCDEAIYILLW